MPDINIDISYPEHRKAKRTVGLLGRGSDVLPIRLWLYCGRQHPDDGRLSGYSAQEIESVCDWWGEKGKMVEAFLTVGWLETVEDGFQVHDWMEHQGHLVAYKQRAKDAANARWKRIRDATSIPQALLDAPSSNAKNSIVSESSVPSSEGVSKGDGDDCECEPSKFSKARIVLHFLNQQAGRNYRETGPNLSIIQARIDEVKGDVDGIKVMVNRQCTRWKGTEQEEYLRPETLFNRTKFGSYYDNRNNSIAKANGSSGKPNARNFGITGDQAERNRRISDTIARRQAEASASNRVAAPEFQHGSDASTGSGGG